MTLNLLINLLIVLKLLIILTEINIIKNLDWIVKSNLFLIFFYLEVLFMKSKSVKDMNCKQLESYCQEALRKWKQNYEPTIHFPKSNSYDGWLIVLEYMLNSY